MWVGWFGFNGGSALEAGAQAGWAILATHLSAAAAALMWMALEWIAVDKPTSVGVVTGAVAGLATITPASGYVGPMGAIAIGLLGGAACFYATGVVKQRLKIGDSLDVFAVHGIGGMLGSLALFALSEYGGFGLAPGMTGSGQLKVQALAVGAVALWAAVATFVIVKICALTTGLRVDAEDEYEGLDVAVHGERGYELTS